MPPATNTVELEEQLTTARQLSVALPARFAAPIQTMTDTLLEFLNLTVRRDGDDQVTSESPLAIEYDGGLQDIRFGANVTQSFVVSSLAGVRTLGELLEAEADLAAGLSPSERTEPAAVTYQRIAAATWEVLSVALREVADLRGKFDRVQPEDLRRELAAHIRRVATQLRLLQQELEADSAVDRITERAGEAEAIADDVAASAGLKATADLALYFDEFAKARALARRYWTVASFICLAVSLGLAIFHIGLVDHLTTSDVLRKVALGLPLAVFLSITTYEASVERSNAMWARHMSVQLRTVRLFTAELDVDSRDQVRREFGRVAFSGPPHLGRNGSSDDETGLVSLLRVVEAVKALK